MSDVMSDAELEMIEHRLLAASQLWFKPDYQKPQIITNAFEDSELIRNAPMDIAALVAEVRRLRWELKTAYTWIQSQGQEVPREWRAHD